MVALRIAWAPKCASNLGRQAVSLVRYSTYSHCSASNQPQLLLLPVLSTFQRDAGQAGVLGLDGKTLGFPRTTPGPCTNPRYTGIPGGVSTRHLPSVFVPMAISLPQPRFSLEGFDDSIAIGGVKSR